MSIAPPGRAADIGQDPERGRCLPQAASKPGAVGFVHRGVPSLGRATLFACVSTRPSDWTAVTSSASSSTWTTSIAMRSSCVALRTRVPLRERCCWPSSTSTLLPPNDTLPGQPIGCLRPIGNARSDGGVVSGQSALGRVLLAEPYAQALRDTLGRYDAWWSSALLTVELRRLARREGLETAAEKLHSTISTRRIGSPSLRRASRIDPSRFARSTRFILTPPFSSRSGA